MKKSSRQHLLVISLLVVSVILRYILTNLLAESFPVWERIAATILILGVGAVFVLRHTADVIEETTATLSNRTHLAGGLLQSLGTAFPDMAMGVVAAVLSLSLRTTNYSLAISYALIAAATTFGSNIYNIGYALWCISRQNTANFLRTTVPFLPFSGVMGKVRPMSEHLTAPSVLEFDTAIDVLNALTLVTALVAVSMVLLGKVATPPAGFSGDLYQLIRPVGAVIFLICVFVMYKFRKTKKAESPIEEIEEEEDFYARQKLGVIWVHLFLSGISILLAAESMVHSVQVFCEITHIPFVVAGALAGVIGCLGEILVIHSYTVNPKGRLGDALVGIGMDNIVTTLGASIVALMGGIFLGGNALILIFVLILTLNGMLMWQVSKLKNFYLVEKA